MSKLINDLQCGSGRLGSSRHVRRIISEVCKRVSESFAVFSAKLERDVLTALIHCLRGYSLDKLALSLGDGLPDYAASLEFR
jgi:hypothetical protein